MADDASREDNGGEWCKECERYYLGPHTHTPPPTMDRPHEFVEDVADGSMCICGIPALTHDAVMYARQEERDGSMSWQRYEVDDR